VYPHLVDGHAENCCPKWHRSGTLPAMNFPKFWVKGAHTEFTCWRWSDSSGAEAAALAQEAARFRDWESRYLKRCRGYSTCELTAAPGSQQIDLTVQLILKVHDEITLAGSPLELA
jgi:hypothetical protein